MFRPPPRRDCRSSKLTVWYGLSAPKGTPAPIVAKLNQALSVAMDDPIVVKRFADLGYDVRPAATAFTGRIRGVHAQGGGSLARGARLDEACEQP
jgi:hypothetical protein